MPPGAILLTLGKSTDKTGYTSTASELERGGGESRLRHSRNMVGCGLHQASMVRRGGGVLFNKCVHVRQAATRAGGEGGASLSLGKWLVCLSMCPAKSAARQTRNYDNVAGAILSRDVKRTNLSIGTYLHAVVVDLSSLVL